MTHTVVLFDVDEEYYQHDALIDGKSLGCTQHGDEWSIRLKRLHGGLSDGIDIVVLNNGCTELSIMPTRGMGIWKGNVAGVPLEWKSPVERPVHPKYVDEMRRGGIGWLDGFNEVICRCGLSWHGAPGNDVVRDDSGNVVSEQFLPLHGRIANLSAHKVVAGLTDDGEIYVTGVVDEASVFGGRLRLISTLKTHVGSNTFEIHDRVENLGSASAEVEMLYHCNFGRPFLGEGATFHTAASEVAPRDSRAAEGIDNWQTYSGPETGYAEQVYFTSPVSDSDQMGVGLLKSPSGQEAVQIRFDTRTLPWLVQWKNTQAEADGYCTGLEPGSSLPNLRTFERQQGRVINLVAGSHVDFNLAVTVAVHADDVEQLVAGIEEQQGTVGQVVHNNPKKEWSP